MLNIAKASFLFEVDFSGSIICSLHQFHMEKKTRKKNNHHFFVHFRDITAAAHWVEILHRTPSQ